MGFMYLSFRTGERGSCRNAVCKIHSKEEREKEFLATAAEEDWMMLWHATEVAHSAVAQEIHRPLGGKVAFLVI